MASFPLIVIFFGGLFLLFVFGRCIGHLFKLDKYFENDQPSENVDFQPDNCQD